MGDREDLCGRTVGEFVLRERIDEGGFGAVYRCEQPLLGREAVVKVLHQRLRRNDVVLQRFLREAQLASRLDHPYAAHVYAFGIEHDDGLFWIAMEMVQGTTLNRWLRERGPLPLEQFVPFFERVAEVVQTAHDRGIVHRDLKPSNVMVVERAGRLLPKLLDFGIAKVLDEAAAAFPASSFDMPVQPGERSVLGDPIGEPVDIDPSSTGSLAESSEGHERTGQWSDANVVTLTGSLAPPSSRRLGAHRLTHADATVGSPPYMSPEQWSNAVTVGPASDLYSLGIVAYEALTGRRPFEAASLADYVELHCNAPVPPLGEGFSPAMDRLFQRALAKQPEERWGTALELATALRAASGIGSTAVDLPRLDESVRDTWLADAPQPLAESVAALDGARNVHQARDAAQELVRNLVRYLLGLALATHSQVRDDRGEPGLIELVREMRRRDLRDEERVRLIRLLVRPLTTRRGAHPIPELVDLVTPGADDGADGLDAVLALHASSDQFATEDLVRTRLARLVPELAHVLRKLGFLLDYVLVVPRNQAAERWTGLRRHHRALATVASGELVKHRPVLLDRDARVCVDLWPLVQAVSPTEGAPAELFLFDGRGRHGARMIAAPAGFEHHDPSVWEWLAARVLAEVETNPSVAESDHAPYLGLMPFSTSDAGRFVGREGEVDAFHNRLRQRALQVVVGPSGAGKSSFVHAGVIPGLPPSWRVVAMRPGSAPISALVSRLIAMQLVPAELRRALEGPPASAAAAVVAAVMEATASGSIVVVVVIDQLEELFTLCADPDERVQFAGVIAQLAASVDAPVRVICAIRDDFLMKLEALAPVRPLLSPALVLLGNPSRDALVRIVVEPARRAGYSLSDPELAHEMVNAVADRPGALALLSFTASRLWELRDRRFRQLTRNAYDAMGGVGGALGRHAEATLDQCSADEQRIVREVFRYLVTPEGMRALVPATELHQRLAGPIADAVIDKLVDARLIAISDREGESHVEMIHDALFAAWPRLQQWVREDVEGARMLDEIRTSARQWDSRHRPRGLLWRDDVLADLERWLRTKGPIAFSEREAAFIDASRRFARRAWRARRISALLAFGLLLVFAAFQYKAALETKAAKQLAETRLTQSYVEAGRHALLDGKFTEALVYLAHAVKRGGTSLSESFMLARALETLEWKARLRTTNGRMWSARYAPDGKRIVTSDDSGAYVWNAQNHEQRLRLDHGAIVLQAVFSPDGSNIVTAGADGSVKYWSAVDGRLLRALTRDTPDNKTKTTYYRAVFDPAGHYVAAIDSAGATTTVWRLADGELVAELPSGGGSKPSLGFSHDGKWLAATGGQEVVIVNAHDWSRLPAIEVRGVSGISFDPTGPRLAIASERGDVVIWELPSATRVRVLDEIRGRIDHITYSPNGAFVAVALRDGAEQVWSTASGALQAELKNHRGAITTIVFSPSSKLLASAGPEGALAISDIATGIRVATYEGARAVVATVEFAPSSEELLVASSDGTASIWDAVPIYLRWVSPTAEGGCTSNASVTEDRRFLALTCSGRTRFWDVANRKLLAEIPTSATSSGDFYAALPAISPTGDRGAIAIGDAVAVYKLPGGELERMIVHRGHVTAVAFSSTGRDVVSGSIDGALLVTRDGGEPVALPGVSGGINAVGFAPSGRVIVAGYIAGLRIYDPDQRVILVELPLPNRIRSFRFSPDGQRLLTIPAAVTAGAPALWDLVQYRRISLLEGHFGAVLSARFVRDGMDILTASSDGAARLWDGRTGTPRKAYLGTSQGQLDAVTDPTNAMVITAGIDGVLRFWDIPSGALLWTWRAHTSPINGLQFVGSELVTREFKGQLAWWTWPKPRSWTAIDRILRCLPLRFDEGIGGLAEQPRCDRD